MTIIKFVGDGKYEFLCSCGELCVKNYGDVKRGKTKSCGHLKRQQLAPNVEGTKYNKLLAIKELDIVNGQREYLFRCDCGNEVVRHIKEVKRGKLMSCGCGVGNYTNHGTHHLSKTRLYGIHKNMIRRCNNIDDTNFHHYGGRGITVCEEWIGEEGLYNFIEWAIYNGYAENLSIDRIDNNGNYEPSNCRWVDLNIQANNKRSNVFITYENKTQTLAEWSEELGLTYDSLWKRINKYNYPFEKAITHRIHKISKSK